MAAFLTSWKMAIRHNFFIDHYLNLISSCNKMATWPFIFRVKRIGIRMTLVLSNP
jgi:hypothetical protein